MHTVTLAEIKKFNPCESGITNLVNQLVNQTFTKETITNSTAIPYDFIIANCPLNDAIWGLQANKAGVQIVVKFARLCADHVSHLDNNWARLAAASAASAAAVYAVAVYAAYAYAYAYADADADAAEREWQKQQLLKLCTATNP